MKKKQELLMKAILLALCSASGGLFVTLSEIPVIIAEFGSNPEVASWLADFRLFTVTFLLSRVVGILVYMFPSLSFVADMWEQVNWAIRMILVAKWAIDAYKRGRWNDFNIFGLIALISIGLPWFTKGFCVIINVEMILITPKVRAMAARKWQKVCFFFYSLVQFKFVQATNCLVKAIQEAGFFQRFVRTFSVLTIVVNSTDRRREEKILKNLTLNRLVSVLTGPARGPPRRGRGPPFPLSWLNYIL